MKAALIPIAILSPIVFFYALGLFFPVPVWITLLSCIALTAPASFPFLSSALPQGRARTLLQRIFEAIGALYLYFLMFLTIDGCVMIVFHFCRARLSLSLLFGLSFLVYALVIVSGVLHARKIAVKRLELHLPYDGVNRGKTRAVFFSDLHLGYFTSTAFLTRLGKVIGAQDPDLVLYGGDLFDSDFSELRRREEAIAFWRSLPCPDGCYLCPGNHDALTKNDPDAAAFMKSAKLTMLNDESVSLPCFDLFGRKDLAGKRLSAEEVCRSTLRTLAVLDHRPKDVEKLIDGGASLVLSGHVHNGQSFPGNLLARLTGKYNYGLKRYGDGYAYTTSGAGYCGLPIRFLTSNEIVVLDLFFE